MNRSYRPAGSLACLIAVVLMGMVRGAARAADIPPTPHDEAHLIVIRPTGWVDAKGPIQQAQGGKAGSRENDAAIFDKTCIAVDQPVRVAFSAHSAGQYTLWVRVGQAAGKQSPLTAEIARADKTLLEGALNHNAGGINAGGPEGFRDYRDKAIHNTPNNIVGDPSLIQLKDLSTAKVGKPSKKDDDLANDVLQDMRAGTGENWVTTSRVDPLNKDCPFYWWKIGGVKLEAGEYELRIRPQGSAIAANAPLVDAAILTTFDKLVYPYAGDIIPPRASYIRFRLDKIPADGVQLSAVVNNHVYPYFRTPGFHLNPDGLSELKLEKTRTTGFTRWYCLQDVKRMVPVTGHEVTLHVLTPEIVASLKLRGATQFAVFPHADAVVRTIDWNEPDGLFISMSPDFQANPHLLRTARDHARENYEQALIAAGGRPYPLARPGDLSITNYSAASLGDDYDYEVKSMRLLGFNSIGIRKAVKTRENYGGATPQGIAALPTHVPFIEEESRKAYFDYFHDLFKASDQETLKGVDFYQIADEPSEAYRSDMTAPLWRYEQDPMTVAPRKGVRKRDIAGGQWVDLAGGSDLNTRRTDYSNCVLEGKITKMGGWVGYRVGIDNAKEPTRYAYWIVGKVGPNGTPENVGANKFGMPGATFYPFYSLRPAVKYNLDSPTPFKVVYEGTRAALYINGELAHEHKDIPATGGFGLYGPSKSISELNIRPIHKGEHIAPDVVVSKEFVERPKPGAEDPVLEDPAAGPKVEPRPLKEYVEQEWTPAGGIPGAHAGFRKWAAAKGLTPDLFGQKNWDDVHMLTVKELVRNADEARLFYWSRRYSGFLTARMFKMAADGAHANAPNKDMIAFFGLSGHTHYFPGEMPMDMFEIGNQGYPLMPGISDWMFYGSWRWDSHQSVAYSVAPMNTGARRWNPDGSQARPASYPMMHCVYPNLIRAYTMLANQVKCISCYSFGPLYAVPGDYWSESPESYEASSLTCNRVGQIDDVISNGRMRPSRVALLYSHSTEYWDSQSAYSDRRAAFLALSHEYFQPELITEDLISGGALKHYDALYVMDPFVSSDAQKKISEWVNAGGLLHASAEAMTRNEFNEPLDGLATLAHIQREYPPFMIPTRPPIDPKIPADGPMFMPVKGEVDFRPHTVVKPGVPLAIKADGARIRAKYSTGMPAWLERAVGKGKVVYIAHHCGQTYTAKATRPGGYADIWADTGRASLTLPLLEAKVRRELVLSEPTIMATPLSTADGTAIVLYNMRPLPVKKLDIDLLELTKPVSVQGFEGLKLVDLPFDFADGRVRITLRNFEQTQMIVVRRKPAPADNRLQEMQKRTIAELGSKDTDDLSAGAWFASFHPEWKLAEKLPPLLSHPRWEVRRAAAEALGRLEYAPAADVLLSALHRETDSHALGDEIVALGQLHNSAVPLLAAELLNRDDPMVRRLAVRAVQTSLRSAGAKEMDQGVREIARHIAERALLDPNLRVQREGIALIMQLDVSKALDAAIVAFADPNNNAAKLSWPDWTTAIATNDAAFKEFIHRGLPGGDELLLELGAARPDPALARAVEARLVELDSANPGKIAVVVIRQADRSLARRMFEARSKLSPKTVVYVAHALEHAYDAQLGDVMGDWDAFINSSGASAKAIP